MSNQGIKENISDHGNIDDNFSKNMIENKLPYSRSYICRNT
jgi:hypothetical protein